MRALYTSHEIAGLPGSGLPVEGVEFTELPADGVSTREQLAEYDALCLVGNFPNEARARQLAGVVRLALPDGLIVMLAYPTVLDEANRAFISRLGVAPVAHTEQARQVTSPHPVFEAYFSVFGQSRAYFDAGEVVDDEILAYILVEPGERPTALCLRRGQGAIYLVPYYIAGAQRQFLPELFAAVIAHREGLADAVPPFLADLRLPGEQDVLDQIAQHASELEELQGQASNLERFRHLVGRLSGGALETRIIETLNLILEGSGYSAIDREDVRVEDFWIIGPDGDFALAEAKGQNTHIRRDDVNQVDSHREEIGERAANMPGLLIVNIFRGGADLDQRRLPVAGQAVRRAASSDVLVLRTYDLYNLLARKMAGEDVGEQLIDILGQGGGWFEVTPDTCVLHTA